MKTKLNELTKAYQEGKTIKYNGEIVQKIYLPKFDSTNLIRIKVLGKEPEFININELEII